MNWLDGAILVVILWFTIAAFHAGFIREIVTVVAVILGLVLAGLLYKELADDVLVFIDNESVARIIAFGIIFAATTLAGQALAMVLKPAVNLLQLGIFDQLAGGVFGFVKATLFIQIFLVVFVTYPEWGLGDTIEGSFFGSFTIEMVDAAPVIVRMLPDEFENEVKKFTDRL